MNNKIKRNKKIFPIFSLLSSISVIPITIVSCNTLNDRKEENNNSFSNINNNRYKYLFNNKYYDSIDNITKEIIESNNVITNDLYYGDIKNAIFDLESKRININALRKYDPTRLSEAWIDALNNKEVDFVKAKKTFINPGLISYKYKDTQGKLYSSYDEAKRAIINSTKVDHVSFYNILDNNNKKVKINPLNKQDIDKFKSIALSKINETKDNVFDLDPYYLKLKDENNNNIYTQMGHDSQEKKEKEFWYKNNIQDILEKLKINFNSYVSKIQINDLYNYLSNNRYNIELELVQNSSNVEYGFRKLSLNSNEVENINDKKLMFKNVRLNELDNFNVFLNRKHFFDAKNEKTNGFTIETWVKNGWSNGLGNDVAREAKIKYKTNNYFEIHYVGGSWGSKPGVDYDILQQGTVGQELYFQLSIKETDEQKKINNNFLNFIINFIQENKQKSKIVSENLLDFIKRNKSQIINKEENRLFSSYNNIFIKNIGNNESSYKYHNSHAIKKSEFDTKNLTLDQFSNNISNNSNNFIIQNLFNLDNLIQYLNNNNIIDTLLSKDSIWLTHEKRPIFLVNFKSINNFQDINNSDTKKTILEIIKEKISRNIMNINLINLSNYVHKKENNLFQINEKSELVKFNENTGLFVIPDTIKNYRVELAPNATKDPFETSAGIWNVVDSYNRSYAYYENKNDESLEKIKEKKFNKEKEGILVLSKSVVYANYLGLKYDFNERMSEIETKLIYDKPQLELVKNTSNQINPSKIIVVYNLAGDVVNPGVVLGDDLVLQTTSDALYDSETTILDNLYRTLIIKKSENEAFYRNDNGTYSLVNVETNFVYTLEWDRKKYYFSTYKDAWLYLKELIKNQVVKISI